MNIPIPAVLATALGVGLAICTPAAAQHPEPAAQEHPGAAQRSDTVPGPFADDATIQQRLEEIVELAKKSTEDAHRYDITTLTCSEFLELAASNDPNDYAVMAMLMVWTHGYHSGLRGVNFHAYPLDTQGIVSLTTQMVSVCREHPKELFHVAALHLD